MELRHTSKVPLPLPPGSDSSVPLEEIITTAELNRRPSRPPDYEAESRALAELMDAMASSSFTTGDDAHQRITSVLQQLVEVALHLCRAHSAGISILEQQGERKIFRWRAIAGQWEQFSDNTMPREASPCGTVLDRNGALLMAHPERHYACLPVELPISEMLLVPFHCAGEPVGTLWIITHDDTRTFDAEDYRLLTSLNRFAASTYQLLVAQEANAQLKAELSTTRQAKEASYKSEALYRVLAANMPGGGVFVVDHDLCYLVAEGQALADAGMVSSDFEGKQLHEALDAEQARAYEPQYRQVLAGKPFRYEHRSHDRNYISHGVPLRDATGAVYAALAVSYDITERKHAEEALHDSEERYRSLFNSIDEGFCIIEVLFDDANKPIDYRFLEANPVFERQTGLGDAIGKTARELVPNLESHWFDIYGNVALTGTSTRFVDGSDAMNRWFDVYAFRIDKPEEHKVALIFKDITSRRATEQALRDRERLLGTLLKVSDAARNLRDEGDIAREACRLVKEETGAVSCSYGFAYPEEDRVLVVADVCDIDDGVPCTEGEGALSGFGPELIALHELGEPVVIEDTAVHPATAAFQQAFFDAMHTRSMISIPLLRDGRFVAYFSIRDRVPRHYTEAEVSLLHDVAVRVWDVIQRSRAETALRESEARLQVLYAHEQAARAQAEEASRLKDEFLATVSHELRTPLTSFLGYGQLVRRRASDSAYVARTIEKMLHSAKSQAELIDDLLDVSRIVSGKLSIVAQPIDLTDVIRAAIDTVRPTIDAKGIRLEVELPAQASAIIGDANRLQQVVWNLLSNATKFTPSGGVIHVQLEPYGQDVQLTISDTGLGISADFLPFVFDRFRQADGASNRTHNGLGLGLAIVRHLIELHGGTVQAASAGEGQGATFTVRLPRSLNGYSAEVPDKQTDERDTTGACPPELAGVRVLLVDDQPDILELLHDILASCHAVVQSCTTAQEALEAVRTWQPEVLVCDIAMPGEDGYWLIRQIRALAPEEGGTVPAVALTAYVRVEERIRVLAAGFQMYVPKPVEPDELRTVVARLAQSVIAE